MSPYELRDYLVCPRKWWLGKRWVVSGDDPARRVLGAAVAAGLAHAYQGILGKGVSAIDDLDLGGAIGVAHRHLEIHWDDSIREWTIEGAQDIVRKSVKVGLSTADRLLSDGVVLAVEANLGGIKPDLLVRRPKGIRVIDHKWSAKIDPRYIEDRFKQQLTDIQLWDYAARLPEAYGETVIEVGFHLITAAPSMKAWFEPIDISKEHLALYRADRERWVREIVVVEHQYQTGAPPGRWTACNNRDENYGKCVMWDACHIHHLVPERMAGWYEKRT